MTRVALRVGVLFVLASGIEGCGAMSKSQSSVPKSDANGSSALASPAPGASPATANAPVGARPPPPAPAQPGMAPQPDSSQPAPSRTQALQSASNDVDSSQRELDVAAGDCRNACRALGSMDRAAGRLCGLVQGEPESRRCDDAKRRVYSARERVKATCGQCENGASVDRSAPIPSLR